PAPCIAARYCGERLYPPRYSRVALAGLRPSRAATLRSLPPVPTPTLRPESDPPNGTPPASRTPSVLSVSRLSQFPHPRPALDDRGNRRCAVTNKVDGIAAHE